jgi:hypothetical protein
MTTKTKTPEERSAAATIKELRARDAEQAMREYELEKLAVRARTEQLRAMRLSRESQASSSPPPPAPRASTPKTAVRLAKKRS